MRGSAKTRGSPHLAQQLPGLQGVLGGAGARLGARRSWGQDEPRQGQGGRAQCGTPPATARTPRGSPARAARLLGAPQTLTMLPLCSAPLRTASPGAAAAPHARPGRAAALYRGRHPGLGAGGPARSLCINSCASPVFLLGLHR